MRKIAPLAVLLFLIAAAPSQAWTNPLRMSFPDESSTDHAVGIDGVGNAVVVIRNANDGIFVNTRGADESSGEPRRVNTGHGQQPEIATNAAGRSAIAWIGTDGADARAHLRVRRPDGTFGSDETISPVGEDATRPEVGIDNTGDAFVSWEATDGTNTRTYLRVKTASSGSLGSVRGISPATGTSSLPHLAVEPGGRAFMTYHRGNQVFGRARSVTGALSAAVVMIPADTIFSEHMSLGGSGRALIAWSGGDNRVHARTRAADGHLSSIATLSKAGPGLVTDEVKTAMGSTNDAGVVSWVLYGDTTTVMQDRRLVGSDWKAAKNVTPTTITPANVAMDASADLGRVIWVFTSFEDGGSTQRLRAREQRADNSLGPLSIVSADNGFGAGPARVAVNASGDAAASWLARLSPSGFDFVWTAANFIR